MCSGTAKSREVSPVRRVCHNQSEDSARNDIGCMVPVVHHARDGDECGGGERYDAKPAFGAGGDVPPEVQFSSEEESEKTHTGKRD